jgi:hypothetical protein
MTFHQGMCIRDLGIEFERLESAESANAAQAATTASHKDWLDIKTVDVSVQRGLSNLFTSGRAQKAKLEDEKASKASNAFQEYYKKGEQEKVTWAGRPDSDFSRFGISSYRTSATTKPATILRLNPGQNSGHSSVVRLGLD